MTAERTDPRPAERDDASSVDKPAAVPPDQGKAYDPEMTVEDEANIPPDSDADPQASPEADGEAPGELER